MTDYGDVEVVLELAAVGLIKLRSELLSDWISAAPSQGRPKDVRSGGV